MIDIYLTLSGIKGESRDSEHEGGIECKHVSWGATQPKSVGETQSGYSHVGFSMINIVKEVDVSTPLILQALAKGDVLTSAKIEYYRADGNGERVRYLVLFMEKVIIADFHSTCGDGKSAEDHFSLRFGKVSHIYTQQRVSGGVGGNTVSGWDLETNRPYQNKNGAGI